MDGDDADACADLYSPDAVVTIDDVTTLRGRDEVRGIVTSDAHQAILPGCAHVMGPFTVHVSGDTATATGYATVYVAGDVRAAGLAPVLEPVDARAPRRPLESAATRILGHRTCTRTGDCPRGRAPGARHAGLKPRRVGAPADGACQAECTTKRAPSMYEMEGARSVRLHHVTDCSAPRALPD